MNLQMLAERLSVVTFSSEAKLKEVRRVFPTLNQSNLYDQTLQNTEFIGFWG